MNKLLYLLFLSIFLLEFFSTQLGLFGRYVTWLPEIISMMAILIISARFILVGGKDTPQKVVFFLGLFFLNIIIGAILNQVPAGPLVAGIRNYLKYLPFFVLPFFYRFSSEQINGQLKLLLFLFLIQCPVALYQRFVITAGANIITGDWVRGTLTESGLLTVALTCAIAVLMTFYLAKRISLKYFILLFTFLFIPMTINETKAAFVLLPFALFLPMHFSAAGIKLKQLIPMLGFITVAGIAFIFIYDYLITPRWGYGIIDFLTTEGRTENYLYKGTTKGHIGSMGKMDSYIVAFQTLSDDILNLLFGLGIGNISESFVPGLSGEYAEKYKFFYPHTTELSLTLWELGMFGVMLYFALFFLVYKDSRRLSKQDGLIGILSNAMSTVTVLMFISEFYITVFQENVTGCLYWYFSGLIISEHFRYRKQKRL